MAVTLPDQPSFGALLHDAASRLASAGIEGPRREARLLLAAALGLPRAARLPFPQTEAGAARLADNDALARFDAMLARRVAREPLALITGRQGFWTLDLAVSPATLIPRADSETLIEAALARFPDRAAVTRILDLGTGTGALLLAALSEFYGAFGVGVDRSEAACRLAAANAAASGLAARAAILSADWAAPLCARFDLVLANPPYIETPALAGLMPEVRAHEPAGALDGGVDGLACYRAIIPALPALLSAEGVAILEIGEGQAPAVAAIAGRHGLVSEARRRDLAGIERALCLAPASDVTCRGSQG